MHCYPHRSVNSLHLHIVDEYHTEDGIKPEYSNLGPSFDHFRFKNLHIDRVIEALEREANPQMKQPGRQGSGGRQSGQSVPRPTTGGQRSR